MAQGNFRRLMSLGCLLEEGVTGFPGRFLESQAQLMLLLPDICPAADERDAQFRRSFPDKGFFLGRFGPETMI